MDLGLSGKTVLVTGSTAGIGFAAASRFAEEGASVVVNGRSETRVAEAVGAIARDAKSAHVSGIVADVSNAEGVQTLTTAAPEVDVLVNNAGIFEPIPFEEIPDEDWLRFFETNVMSGVRLSRHYLKGMLARNWGRIVFVSSESALQIPVEMIHYGMTRTLFNGLDRHCGAPFVRKRALLLFVWAFAPLSSLRSSIHPRIRLRGFFRAVFGFAVHYLL